MIIVQGRCDFYRKILEPLNSHLHTTRIVLVHFYLSRQAANVFLTMKLIVAFTLDMCLDDVR